MENQQQGPRRYPPSNIVCMHRVGSTLTEPAGRGPEVAERAKVFTRSRLAVSRRLAMPLWIHLSRTDDAYRAQHLDPYSAPNCIYICTFAPKHVHLPDEQGSPPTGLSGHAMHQHPTSHTMLQQYPRPSVASHLTPHTSHLTPITPSCILGPAVGTAGDGRGACDHSYLPTGQAFHDGAHGQPYTGGVGGARQTCCSTCGRTPSWPYSRRKLVWT